MGDSRSPELWQSWNATQPQPVEAHTLTRTETNQLRCRSGAQTQCTRIWWNFGVTSVSVSLCTHKVNQAQAISETEVLYELPEIVYSFFFCSHIKQSRSVEIQRTQTSKVTFVGHTRTTTNESYCIIARLFCVVCGNIVPWIYSLTAIKSELRYHDNNVLVTNSCLCHLQSLNYLNWNLKKINK